MKHLFTPETAIQDIANFYTIEPDETAKFLLDNYPVPDKFNFPDPFDTGIPFSPYITLAIEHDRERHILCLSVLNELTIPKVSIVLRGNDTCLLLEAFLALFETPLVASRRTGIVGIDWMDLFDHNNPYRVWHFKHFEEKTYEELVETVDVFCKNQESMSVSMFTTVFPDELNTIENLSNFSTCLSESKPYSKSCQLIQMYVGCPELEVQSPLPQLCLLWQN